MAILFHSDFSSSYLPSNHGFDIVMDTFRSSCREVELDTVTWILWNIFMLLITSMNSLCIAGYPGIAMVPSNLSAAQFTDSFNTIT